MRPVLAALLAVSSAIGAAATPAVAGSLPSGHFTLTGAAAASVTLPSSLTDHQIGSWHDSIFNLDYTRYQQYVGGSLVDGGQVTVVSRNGARLIVAGGYYPNLPTVRAPTISIALALSIAADLRGGLGDLPEAIRELATRRVALRVNHETGRPFYLVSTAAPANNGYQQIDALSGELLAAWSGVDQVNTGEGTGVKGDTKVLSPSTFAVVANLTSQLNGDWKLQSPGGTSAKFITYDAHGGNAISTNPVMTDNGTNLNNDNKWTASAQQAGVDAQYYAALTVQFYLDEFGYNWMDDCAVDSNAGGPHGTFNWPHTVRSVVHYDESPNSTPYDNAFWDQEKFYMVYGDGGTVDRPLSAGQDVVSHELSHAVTQCRENLDYQGQSGALNEAFSDIMATAAEFLNEENVITSNCRRRPGQTECADWLIGEDLAKTASGAVIRDLADPGAEGQPSHYQDRYGKNCSSFSPDYCYVHTDSGIANHAFYLLATGGRNARCSGPTDVQDDCDVVVPGIGVDHAAHLFFAGFGMLTNDATMCDARNATVAQAGALYPGSVADQAGVLLAWQAVGLAENCDDSTDFTISLSDPTVELAPAGIGTTDLSVHRLSDHTQINYSVDKTGPATVGASPANNPGIDSSGTTITVTADNNAADGVYPILVTASSNASGPHYAAASMVIDAEGPVVAVNSVGFATPSTVSPSGDISLTISWSASDSGSGVASKKLDHSPTGSGWASIGTTSPTTFPAPAGPHQFQVSATDAVGNNSTSTALIRNLTAYQETAATYTYPLSWKTNNTGTQWGTTKYSTKRGATATLTFTGKSVVWVAQRGPKRGVANVFVDGVKTHVDLYSGSLTERRVVFIASNLSAGQHTIKVKVKGTSNRPRVDIDGFFVLS